MPETMTTSNGRWILPEDMPLQSRTVLPRQRCGSMGESVAVSKDRGCWIVPPPRASVLRTSTLAPAAAIMPVTATGLGDPVVQTPVFDEPAATAERVLPSVTALAGHAAHPDHAAHRTHPAHTDHTAHSVKPLRGTRWYRPVVVGGVAAALLVSVGSPTFGAGAKTITVSVDGAARTISTEATSVGDALASVGISVGPHDVLFPSASSVAGDGSQITLRHARRVTASVGGKPRTIWTTATTVSQALTELGIDESEYRISADRDRPIGLNGLTISGHRLHSVTVVDGAGASKSLRTAAGRVADLLTAQGISLHNKDKVTPAPGSAVVDGEKIVVTRMRVTNRTVSEKIKQPVAVIVDDASIGKGEEKLTDPGADGLRAITIQQTTVNGKATEKVLSNTVVRKPAVKVTKIGTKETGLPESWSVPWDKLAFCESTGRWDLHYGEAGALGGLQFITSTWIQFGGGEFAPSADLATKEQQIIVAERLYKAQGLAPWACARILGWGFGKYQG